MYTMRNTVKTSDGDAALGILGNFQLGNVIYVLNEEANTHLLADLSKAGYKLSQSLYTPHPCETASSHAQASHQTKDVLKPVTDNDYEVYCATPITTLHLSEFNSNAEGQSNYVVHSPSPLIISQKYMGKGPYSLTHPKLHEIILDAADQPSHLGWYTADTRPFSTNTLTRMNAFVQHMVDVDLERWNDFVETASSLYKQDFIRYLAYWAAKNSDHQPRKISMNQWDESEIIDPAIPFIKRHIDGRDGYDFIMV